MKKKSIKDFLPEIFYEISKQEEKNIRWKDFWNKRLPKRMEEYVSGMVRNSYDKFIKTGVPMDYSKLIFIMIIALIREKHPEEIINK